MQTVEQLNPDAFIPIPLDFVAISSPATDALMGAIEVLPTLSLTDGPFIAGGAIVRALLGKTEVSDIDVFCCSSKQFADVIEFLGDKSEPDVNPQPPSMGGGDPSIVNFSINGLKIQVIDAEVRAVPGSKPVDILLGFDITAAMVATDGKNLLVNEAAAWAISNRVIVLNKSSQRKAPLEVRPHLDNDEERVAKYTALLEVASGS